MANVLKDVSVLTTIPEKTLAKLSEKIIYCINDAIEESILNQKEITNVDLGFGTLIIKHTQDEIKYKFIPNKKLESSIINTTLHKENMLQKLVEDTLVKRMTDTYKELF